MKLRAEELGHISIIKLLFLSYCYIIIIIVVVIRNTLKVLKCAEKTEYISWPGRATNAEVVGRVKEENSNLRAIKGRNASWTAHTLCTKYRLKHVINPLKAKLICFI
jgi:hypothetical protein